MSDLLVNCYGVVFIELLKYHISQLSWLFSDNSTTVVPIFIEVATFRVTAFENVGFTVKIENEKDARECAIPFPGCQYNSIR